MSRVRVRYLSAIFHARCYHTVKRCHTMMVRLALTRVALLFQHRKTSRFSNAGSIFERCEHSLLLGAATTRRALAAPSARVWMSRSASDNDHEPHNTNQPATRAMFLGNILPILADTAGVALTGIALALGLLYFQQDKLLYIPEMGDIRRPNASNPPKYRSPTEYGIPYETHMIETGGGCAVHSWLLLHPRSKEDDLPTIIFFHGNAG